MGTYIVTGGSSGIGARVAQDLVAQGERVIIWDIQQPSVDVKAAYERVDLSQSQSVEAAAARFKEPLQAFIHCAGIAATTSIGHANLAEQLRRAYEIHVVSFLIATQLLQDALTQGNGSIVAIVSAAMDMVYPGVLAYGASKAALRRAIEQLAVELGSRNIRVNGIAPGAVRTPMSAAAWADDSYATERKSYIPLAHQAEPQTISDAVLFLVSPKAAYITGEVLWVDGGVRLGIFNTAARKFAENNH